MFEYVHLKNFKNFGDVTFNLCDKHGDPKKFILIYGENGAGKTNLASAFLMLNDSLKTMKMREMLESFFKDKAEMSNDFFSAGYIKKYYKGIESIIENYKMIDSDEPMSLDFGFRTNNNHGHYLIEISNTEIIHECLEFPLISNKTTYFDIKPDDIKINPKIFDDKKAKDDITSVCKQFWGKHSFLAILLHEALDKADHYILDQLSDNLLRVLNTFLNISTNVSFGCYSEHVRLANPHKILDDFDKGQISFDQKDQLKHAEKMLNTFFSTAFNDIVKVHYKKKYEDDMINYRLMITRLIAGKKRDLDISMESTGTQLILKLLPFLLVTAKGSNTIIDEFDIGMHDLLVKALIESIYNTLTDIDADCQLIMTTHSTILMESDSSIPKECLYVISKTEGGNRQIERLTYYDKKINDNTSIRRQYLKGAYDGIPKVQNLDFKQLLNDLES